MPELRSYLGERLRTGGLLQRGRRATFGPPEFTTDPAEFPGRHADGCFGTFIRLLERFTPRKFPRDNSELGQDFRSYLNRLISYSDNRDSGKKNSFAKFEKAANGLPLNEPQLLAALQNAKEPSPKKSFLQW